MNDITYIVLLTAVAGLCMPLGGLLARIEHIGPKWLETEFRHFVIAFGGGLLLGAVFVVLLPEGIEKFGNPSAAVAVFMAGGVLFFLIERSMALRRREAPQLLGMIVDYIPESIALGGVAATDPSLALVLGIVIGLQNVPEGFNAYRELDASRSAGRRNVLWFMLLLTPIGPVSGLAAHFFLAGYPAIIATIMLVSAGGIMYLMFQEIAPRSRLRLHWAPPLGAVAGFALTLLADIWFGQG